MIAEPAAQRQSDPTATIAAVRATPFRLRYATPIVLSDGIRESAEHLLVQVTSSEGVVGSAECIPRPAIYGETLDGARAMIETVLAPRVLGLRLGEPQRIAAVLSGVKGNPAARSSIEVAAFDAFAQTLGVPAYQLLGGAARSVPCAAILPGGDDQIARARAFHDELGVAVFKLKVGGDVDRDARLVAALRAELGPSVTLYADANGRYSAMDAARFVALCAGDGLWGLEEPTAAADVLGRARLAATNGTRIVGDESCVDVSAVAQEVLAGRLSGVSIKLARTGLIGSGRIREFCAAAGIAAIVGTQADSAIGAFASAAFAAAAPSTCDGPAELMFFREFVDTPVDVAPDIHDGRMWLSDRPGFGFAIDRQALAGCAVK
jgi:L-Ala-D/L-Glu epimerase / N-acetyl-D-glutamate racemase